MSTATPIFPSLATALIGAASLGLEMSRLDLDWGDLRAPGAFRVVVIAPGEAGLIEGFDEVHRVWDPVASVWHEDDEQSPLPDCGA